VSDIRGKNINFKASSTWARDKYQIPAIEWQCDRINQHVGIWGDAIKLGSKRTTGVHTLWINKHESWRMIQSVATTTLNKKSNFKKRKSSSVASWDDSSRCRKSAKISSPRTHKILPHSLILRSKSMRIPKISSAAFQSTFNSARGERVKRTTFGHCHVAFSWPYCHTPVAVTFYRLTIHHVLPWERYLAQLGFILGTICDLAIHPGQWKRHENL